MFVGVDFSSERYVRPSKKQAPCIVFIDEIDAVGRHEEQAWVAAMTRESRHSINCVVEMDGFEDNQAIIIIALLTDLMF